MLLRYDGFFVWHYVLLALEMAALQCPLYVR